MAYSTGILLGRIIKVIGFEGAVAVKQEKIQSGKLTDMESVFLEIDGRPVPFFIDELDFPGGDIIKIRFRGYDSPEKAGEFVGCRVFLPTGIDIRSSADDRDFLEGYIVFTGEMIELGMVEKVIPNPGQWLLEVVSSSGRQILIPLHEHLIAGIDKKKRHLIIDIPEGLADLN
jgi:16S rRNA processing protein RimM